MGKSKNKNLRTLFGEDSAQTAYRQGERSVTKPTGGKRYKVILTSAFRRLRLTAKQAK